MDDMHGDALDRIIGDMDDMESKKMFPKTMSGGATITISVMPGSEAEGEEEPKLMNEGGYCEPKKMADGGMVEPPMMGETDEDLSLPPFLRKKKGR